MKWWQIKRRDADLERELQSDLELEEEEQRERGLSAYEARYAARRAFGNTALIKEQAHEEWGVAALEHLLIDVRYAWRQLRRSPGFSAIAVLILALGIGANCTVFSFVDALFLKPLAVAHPERLVRIYAKGPSGHYGAGFSYPEFKLLHDHASSYAGLSIETERPQLHLVLGDDSMEARGEFVSGNYFALLGIQPHLGRSFLPEEDIVPGRNAVVVISDQLWKTRFNGDPAVLGRVIPINSIPFKVIGVAPPEFYGDLPGLPVEVWIPSMMYGAAGYGCDDGTFNCSLFDSMVGALAPGTSGSRAQAEAASIMVWSATDWPERPSRRQFALAAASRESPDSQADDAVQLRLLACATAVLLLIACANLGGLLLARGLARRKEIAVRMSIGAGRSRIVRQLLTESLLLAFLGGILGLMLSLVGKKMLSDFYATDSEGFHHLYNLGLDWRVFVYSMALSLIGGVVFGLVPALRALRHDLITDLKDGGPLEQPTKGWLRSALIAGQIALSMVLIIASGLLIRSASEVRKGTNFDPHNLLVLRLRPELLKYTQPQIETLVHRLEEGLRATPDVQSVAFMEGGEGLVWNWQNGRDAEVSATPISPIETAGLQVRKQDVSSGFFETLKIPILGGREFNEQDGSGSPRAAIVNEALAKRMWPAGSAVGHNLYVNAQSYQIIGVCADLQPESSVYPPEPHLYLSYWQSNATREGDVRLAIRAFGNPVTSLRTVRRAIQSVDPNVPVGEDMPLSEQVSLEYMPILLAQAVMSFCGFLALCLSAMGLYSILAFAVRMRSREIGIRMALGARRQDILRLIVAEGAKLALTGAAAGAVAALISTRLLAGLLYGVRASDPATYIGVTVLLLLVALAACYLPANRAASIDPMEALRSD
jgi:macrolide transport system ATP-binding/permease protein